MAAAPGAPAAPDIAVMTAREAARSAASLEELRAMLAKFEGCALRTTAKQLVFADGNPQARVMFVGEAPGREEDLEGLPFVGRSGKLLDLMMAAINLNPLHVQVWIRQRKLHKTVGARIEPRNPIRENFAEPN